MPQRTIATHAEQSNGSRMTALQLLHSSASVRWNASLLEPAPFSFPWIADAVADAQANISNQHDASDPLATVAQLLLLQHDEGVRRITTWSASTALAACLSTAARHGAVGTQPIAILPSILPDFFTGLTQLAGLTPLYIDVDERSFALDVDSLVRAIERYQPSCVLISSPDNPTGRVLAAEHLVAIGTALAEHGGTFIVDQCLTWGNADGYPVPRAPQTLSAIPNLEWVCIFDTAKAIGQLGPFEKLGFCIASERFGVQLEESFTHLQSFLSAQRTATFDAVFRQAQEVDHLAQMATRIRANKAMLEQHLVESGSEVRRVLGGESGSSYVVDFRRSQIDAETLVATLFQDHGVGVIPMTYFVPSKLSKIKPSLRYCVRVSLSQPTPVIEAVAGGLAAVLRQADS